MASIYQNAFVRCWQKFYLLEYIQERPPQNNAQLWFTTPPPCMLRRRLFQENIHMPIISAVGLFCCDKSEETQNDKVVNISKLNYSYFISN